MTSKGLLLTDGGWVFFEADDIVYRAPESAPLSVYGYSQGARFFCSLWQWPWRQEHGVYPFEQKTLA